LGAVAGKAEIIEHSDPANKGAGDYAYINGTLHGNPVAAAAGLATLDELAKPGFHEKLHGFAEELTGELQAVLDEKGLPAIAAGRASFWQFLFLDHEPANAIEIVNSDQAAMRKLDQEMLRRGVYVLPGVRRFTAAVNTREDIDQTVEALKGACGAF
jgi:glutamate-1-semialdehyde 2,1-aminomutase